MSEFLIFRLYAPMVSWGDIAVGGTRPSADHPSRSTILGLVAGALGLRRDNADAHHDLDNALELAVYAWSTGQLLRDYHTIETPHQRKGEHYRTRADELKATKSGVVLSQRDYRCDALSDIALRQITEQPRFSLVEIGKALRYPVFTPYLGRKSCPPSLPFNPQQVIADDCLAAFRQIHGNEEATPEPEQEVIDTLSGTNSTIRPALYWEGTADCPIQASQTVARRDKPVDRSRWQFTSRQEHFALLPEES